MFNKWCLWQTLAQTDPDVYVRYMYDAITRRVRARFKAGMYHDGKLFLGLSAGICPGDTDNASNDGEAASDRSSRIRIIDKALWERGPAK